MDRIRNKYNPEATELKALSCLEGLTKQEFDGWKSHPCTKALKYTLESELDRLVLNWVKGGFTNNTVEGTALMQTRSVGMTEALEGVLTYVDEMLETSQREDPYEEALRTS